ncbi:S8/S53 family peptidase [Acuticoccus sediminis]|uniref:hypothetical protein n=1 Tax=Acuticoccus sediminis TaxID=2184697 RepID=UPI001CFF489E|nr:hypothetical protein [Acuticoccus sediminis]
MAEDRYDIPLGDPYLRWLIGPGLIAARGGFVDPRNEEIRTPVLIGFRDTTIEAIEQGLDFAEDGENGAAWRDGLAIPAFLKSFNDLTKRLRPDSDDPRGLLEKAGVVMGFASDSALAAYQREAEARSDNSFVPQRIFSVAPGPAIDPDRTGDTEDVGNFADPWRNIDVALTERLLVPFYKEVGGGEDLSFLRRAQSTALFGQSTVVAVIDDAVAYANSRFEAFDPATSAFRTSVSSAWIQRDPAGLVFDRAGIDGQLAAVAAAGMSADDEAVYRRAGVLDFGRLDRHSLAYRASHGTAVLDLANGAPAGDMAELATRNLKVVQLPLEVIRDTSLSRLDAYVFPGFIYLLFNVVIETLMAKFPNFPLVDEEVEITVLPMVVNMSIGNTAGPHDGGSVLERGFDFILRWWNDFVAPLALTLPSGNSHLARIHAGATLRGVPGTASAARVFDWQVQPDDKTESAVEIWLPPIDDPFAPPAPRVRVKALPPGKPDGAAGFDWVTEFDAAAFVQPFGAIDNAWLSVTYSFNPLDRRGVFMVNIAPTAFANPDLAGTPDVFLAPPGRWRILIEKVTPEPGDLPIEAWVQRDDTPFNFRRLGRQSYFNNACYERYDATGHPIEEDPPDGCMVRRSGSMSAIATGCRPVVVGGAVRTEPVNGSREFVLARYSAGGPASTPPCPDEPERKGPDVVARSDDSRVAHGVLAAGTASGSTVSVGGTSIASPQVANALARMADAGVPPTRTQIQAAAEAVVAGPVERVGAGIVRSEHTPSATRPLVQRPGPPD